MIIPNRIRLSTPTTNKLRQIKRHTGVTPNITSRIALMLALQANEDVMQAESANPDGQELNRDILFGEHINIYDVLLKQYIYTTKPDMPVAMIITTLIDIGVHKMGHVKTIAGLGRIDKS